MPRATVRADWSAAIWQRYPRLAQAATLHAQARRYAILSASEALPAVPIYHVVDTHGNAVYATPRYTLAPAFTAWQSEVIAAVSRLRRWRLYSDSPE